MKKRYISIGLILVLLISLLSGCKPKKDDNDISEEIEEMKDDNNKSTSKDEDYEDDEEEDDLVLDKDSYTLEDEIDEDINKIIKSDSNLIEFNSMGYSEGENKDKRIAFIEMEYDEKLEDKKKSIEEYSEKIAKSFIKSSDEVYEVIISWYLDDEEVQESKATYLYSISSDGINLEESENEDI